MNKSDALIPHLPTDVAFKELRRIDRQIALAGLLTWAILGIGAILIIPKVGSGSLLDYILSAKNPSPPTEQTQSDRPQLKAIALSWVGKEFNPGQQAQCAYFVRHVLEEAGVNLPLTQEPWDGVAPTYPGTANSFAGSDIVERVDDLNEGEIGLAFFENTYGDYPPGTITHIGFAIKTDGVLYLVDRPTQSAPVRQKPLSGYKYLARIPSTGDTISRLRNAIAQQESGGDPVEINPHSNAVGSLQVMPANIPSWTQQCLGKSFSVEEFHQDPEAQTEVGNCKLQEYWAIASQQTSDEQTIVRKVAAAWYSGRMELYDNPRPQPYTDPKTGKTHLYPSIKKYTTSVWRRYQNEH